MHGVDKISHGIAGGDPEGAARPTLQEQRAADYSMRGHLATFSAQDVWS